VKILLINPSNNRDILSTTIHEIPYLKVKAFFAPHAIAAVAAVTPDGHDIHLHDEQLRGNVDALLEKEEFDVIGISLVTNQFKRAMEIVDLCQSRGLKARVVVGGIGVSNMITRLARKVDSIFIGEAEETWPLFIDDLESGNVKPVYQKVTKPDMTKVPTPRWDLIAEDIPHYSMVSVQTTRGCPFDCTFCDVIYTFGRIPRSKTLPQILEEIRVVESLKAPLVFYADDNFCGNKKYAKDVLKEVEKLNNSFKLPLRFVTQVDVTIADDEELLCLMADSNLVEVQLGIESINKDSLNEFNKKQNLRHSLVDSINKIQSYGIIALCHMIIGADSDDKSAFDQTMNFLNKANVTQHTCHPLMAPPGTRLWYKMMREGRLAQDTRELSDTLDIVSNIFPKQMSRIEMMRGLAKYWEQVHSPGPYIDRALGFLHGITRWPKVKRARPRLDKLLAMLFGLFFYFLFKVTPDQRRAFLRIFRETAKYARHMIPTMIFVHTGYVIDRKMALRAAEISQKQADWEEANPDKVLAVDNKGVMSRGIRENADEIFKAAYEQIRKHTADRATLYEAVTNAAIDFSDRFGEELTEFDDSHKINLKICCVRASESILDTVQTKDNLPEDSIPAGFTREILDTVDRKLRYAFAVAEKSG
jgi:radical SAM superfamily enzyme YgiQ (UPF0313 family)